MRRDALARFRLEPVKAVSWFIVRGSATVQAEFPSNETAADFRVAEDCLPPEAWARRFLHGWPVFLLVAIGVGFVLALLSTVPHARDLVDLGWLALVGASLPGVGLLLWEARPGRATKSVRTQVVSAPSSAGTGLGLAFFYNRRRVLAALGAGVPLLLSLVWLSGAVLVLDRSMLDGRSWLVLLTAAWLLFMLLRRSFRRLRNPHSVVLTAAGLELPDGRTSVFTPWENIVQIAPSIMSGGPRLDIFLEARGPVQWRRHDSHLPTAAPLRQYRGGLRWRLWPRLMLGAPECLVYAINYYREHDGARWELETDRAGLRLQACLADDPGGAG